jgi:hypothetical protein
MYPLLIYITPSIQEGNPANLVSNMHLELTYLKLLRIRLRPCSTQARERLLWVGCSHPPEAIRTQAKS